MKHVNIAGGGLAGLALGIALRRRGVPVTVNEAGTYPRHRVCGEFITGVQENTLAALGIQEDIEEGLELRTLSWYQEDRVLFHRELPRKAWGISRWSLDNSLARHFEKLGGELRTRNRIQQAGCPEGSVRATGRTPHSGASGPRWIGLKVHLSGLGLEDDLELHMGVNGYAGISRVEGGKWNLCGLFQQASFPGLKGIRLLEAYLRRSNLSRLVSAMEVAHLHADSFSAVAGMDYRIISSAGTGFVLGDQWSLIPPFTGNGMSLAFETAMLALDPLTMWAKGTSTWANAEQQYRGVLKSHLRGRVLRARILHGLLLSRYSRKILALLARSDALPFRALYALTH